MNMNQPEPLIDTWRNHANCRNHDPDLFFPVGEGHLAQKQIREAKDACLCCDVRDLCLDWALDTGQKHGIWGGKTESERRSIKRRRARRRTTTTTTTSNP